MQIMQWIRPSESRYEEAAAAVCVWGEGGGVQAIEK